MNKRTKKINATVTCRALVSLNDGVDAVDFIKNHNGVISESDNDDGDIISLRITNVEIDGDKNKKPTNDKLERYLHCSFKGTKIIVDTENREVFVDEIPKLSEMIGVVTEGKLYQLNIETSD